MRKKSTLFTGTHLHDTAIAAYQPTSRDNYTRDSTKDDAVNRLREEHRQLKAGQRDQPQRGRTSDSYVKNKAPTGMAADFSQL